MKISKIILLAFIPIIAISNEFLIKSFECKEDIVQENLLKIRHPKSHIKIFIFSAAQVYLTDMIHGGLLGMSDNLKGWDYLAAEKIIEKSPISYEIHIKKGIRFQNGDFLTATDVKESFNYALADGVDNVDALVIKKFIKSIIIKDPFTLNIILKKPYGGIYHDILQIKIFSQQYLKQKLSFLTEGMPQIFPSKYGLGAYYVSQGHIKLNSRSEKLVLRANPYYLEKNKPYIEKVTVFGELSINKAINSVIYREGEIDLTAIPFNKKAEVVISDFAKLSTTKSRKSFCNYFNLHKLSSPIQDKNIRLALNRAINQENLLKFTYRNEGYVSSTTLSVNYQGQKEIQSDIYSHRKWLEKNRNLGENYLKKTLNGIELNVFTQDRFMFLWRGIEYQLEKYGVKLNFTVVTSEDKIFNTMFTNKKTPQNWDIITVSHDDWVGNHPWSVLFSYTSNSSTVKNDNLLNKYIIDMYTMKPNTRIFQKTLKKILNRVNREAYTLVVPSPNLVLAMNKELYYKPTITGTFPIWNAQISKDHWSVRKEPFYDKQKIKICPNKVTYND